MPVASDDMTTSSFSVKEGKPVDPSQHGPPTKMQRRHSVDFVPDGDKVDEFDRVEDEDIGSVWYSREEYDIIKARNSLIVKMIKLGQFEEGEEHSSRGLEHKLRDGFKQRRTNKFNALNAVLEEQDRQYHKGTNEPERIREAYVEVAGNAKETAFIHGLKDSEESYAYTGRPVIADTTADEEMTEDGDTTESDTICSDASRVRNKSRLRSLFRGVSLKRKETSTPNRRSSM